MVQSRRTIDEVRCDTKARFWKTGSIPRTSRLKSAVVLVESFGSSMGASILTSQLTSQKTKKLLWTNTLWEVESEGFQKGALVEQNTRRRIRIEDTRGGQSK